MKSMEMDSQRSSGTGRGCKGPVGLEVEDLLRAQSIQEGMYPFLRSILIFRPEI